MAVEKGQDELAREALTRKKAYEDNARSMKAQLDAQTKASDQLKANMTYVATPIPQPEQSRVLLGIMQALTLQHDAKQGMQESKALSPMAGISHAADGPDMTTFIMLGNCLCCSLGKGTVQQSCGIPHILSRLPMIATFSHWHRSAASLPSQQNMPYAMLLKAMVHALSGTLGSRVICRPGLRNH